MTGYDYYYFDETDSTNNEAKRRIEAGTLTTATLIAAGAQTAGRGRRGKNFYSPKGTGLYMTLTVPMGCALTGQVTITTRVAVAVASAIEKVLQVSPMIKWVNDIYLNDKKCCGILCEAVNDYEAGILKYAVIGIGINIDTEVFPDDIKNVAGSLINVNNRTRDAGNDFRGNQKNDCESPAYGNRVKADSLFAGTNTPGILAEEITANILKDLSDMNNLDYLHYYRSHSNVIGREITFSEGDLLRVGSAVDVDESGALIVRTEDNNTTILNSGEISIRVR